MDPRWGGGGGRGGGGGGGGGVTPAAVRVNPNQTEVCQARKGGGDDVREHNEWGIIDFIIVWFLEEATCLVE